MLKDIELKIKYYTEVIIKSFIEKGIYPNNKLIQSRLNDIELRTSIFKNPNIIEGTKVDVIELNESLNSIYNDLIILYKLVYDITIKEYLSLSNYINSHLQELNEMTNSYLKRAELENYSTALGKTLLYANKNFDINAENSNTIIKLGQIDLYDGMKLVCISDIDNVKNISDITFNFKNNDKVIACNPYNYNHDFLIIPGELKINTYEININKNQKINSLLELPLASLKTEIGSFITMAGKNKILCKKANENGEIIEEKPIGINELTFDKHSYIDFFVVNGSSISFRFNKEPLSTNFNMVNGSINNLDYIQHFFIECDKGFSFDFTLEKGDVYAIKENTIINQNKLYYSGQVSINDFLIIQSQYNENSKKTYDIEVKVSNTSIEEEDINGIIIKKVQ